MPHDFPVPDTERLETLLEQAYAAMQEAEPARLDRLEERLVRRLFTGKRQKKPNRIPWWIVLVAGGGVAMAGWWVAEQVSNRGKDNVPEDAASPAISNPASVPSTSNEDIVDPDKAEETENHDTIQHSDSPVIYQRGTY